MSTLRTSADISHPTISVACLALAGLGLCAVAAKPAALPSLLAAWGARAVSLDFLARNFDRYATHIGALGIVITALAVILWWHPTRYAALLAKVGDRSELLDRCEESNPLCHRVVLRWIAVALVLLVPVAIVSIPLADFSLDDYPIERVLDEKGATASLLTPHLGHSMPGYRLEVLVARRLFGLAPAPRAIAVWIMLVATITGLCVFLRMVGMASIPALAAPAVLTVWTGMTDVSAGFFGSSPYMQVLGCGLWALSGMGMWLKGIRTGFGHVLAWCPLLVVATLIDNAGLWVIPAAIIVSIGIPLSGERADMVRRRRGAIFTVVAVGTIMTFVHLLILLARGSRGDLLAGGHARTLVTFANDIGYVVANSWQHMISGPLDIERVQWALLAPLVASFIAGWWSSNAMWRRVILMMLSSLVIAAAFVAIGRPGIHVRGANTQHLWVVAAFLVSSAAAVLHSAYARSVVWRDRVIEFVLFIIIFSLPVRVLGLLSAKFDWAYRRVEANAVRSFGNWLSTVSEKQRVLRVPWIGGERMCQTVRGLEPNPYDIVTYTPFLASPGTRIEFVVAQGAQVPLSKDVSLARRPSTAISPKLIDAIRSTSNIDLMFFGPINLTLTKHPFRLDLAPATLHNNVDHRHLVGASGKSIQGNKQLEFVSNGQAIYYLRRGALDTSTSHVVEVSAWRVHPAESARVLVAYESPYGDGVSPDWIVVPSEPMNEEVLRVNLARQPRFALCDRVKDLRLVFVQPGTYRVRAAGVFGARAVTR